MSLFGGAPWLPAPSFVETLISPAAREPAVRGSEAGQLHTLQGPVENENVAALMQQFLRFTMVTAEHQASVGVLLRAGPLPPTSYSLYTPAAWSGWRVQGLQCVDKIGRLTLWVS